MSVPDLYPLDDIVPVHQEIEHLAEIGPPRVCPDLRAETERHMMAKRRADPNHPFC